MLLDFLEDQNFDQAKSRTIPPVDDMSRGLLIRELHREGLHTVLINGLLGCIEGVLTVAPRVHAADALSERLFRSVSRGAQSLTDHRSI